MLSYFSGVSLPLSASFFVSVFSLLTHFRGISFHCPFDRVLGKTFFAVSSHKWRNEIFGVGDDVDCGASETLDQHLLKRERLLASYSSISTAGESS